MRCGVIDWARTCIILALAMLVLAGVPAAGTSSQPVAAGRTTYYVALSGSDANAGTSMSAPWRTVARVNGAPLAPGDAVLFQGGATFADATLTPNGSGLAGAPIVFGSYGQGSATIVQGAWFIADYLTFENLSFAQTFYGGSETHGQSSNVTLENVTIRLPPGNTSLGLYSNGNNWVIANSTVDNTGLSGALLNGDRYVVTGDTITNTGLDTTNGYNNHGIYLDASDATITNNTISNFAESAISVRYRGSTITGNHLDGGRIGIDFFQTDPSASASSWSENTISRTTAAGIYVSPSGSGGSTHESFNISGNVLTTTAGVDMNLNPTSGAYVVAANSCSGSAGSCPGVSRVGN
jgi:parallel beta helix pectate lyase-like protein